MINNGFITLELINEIFERDRKQPSKRATKAALDFLGELQKKLEKVYDLLELFGFAGVKNLNEYYKSRSSTRVWKI